MVKRKRQIEAENYDDNAIFYTFLGLLMWLLICGFGAWTLDYCGMLDKKQDGEIIRLPKPIPVLIPEFEGVDGEEYESLIEQNPLQSNISSYKII